jgi:excisionase family DNA binding protein
MNEGLMTVKDVLSYLKIGRTNLYDLINTGKIRTVKIGKRTLFDPKDLMKFIEKQKTPVITNLTATVERYKKSRPKK